MSSNGSSVRPWLAATIKQWAFAVSAVLTLIGAVQEVSSGFHVPTGVLYGLGGAAFLFAQYRAYHTLHMAKDASEQAAAEREAALLSKLDVRSKRKAIRESLGEYFAQGEEVRNWIERAGAPVGKVLDDPDIFATYTVAKETDDASLRGSLERAREWDGQVAAFLAQYLGASYVALFRSQVGTVFNKPPKLGTDEHTDTWRMVDQRLQILSGIIKEAGDDLIGS